MEKEKNEADIPLYFICPVSLQIMRDPVTTVTGITYDRESIEQWLLTAEEVACPVTKQPLSKNSDLTPNHTLRRLIQAWCVLNAKHGIDRIPTPKSPLKRSHVLKLIRDLKSPLFCLNALKKMNVLAGENEQNRSCMVDAGVVEAIVSFVVRCSKEVNTITNTNTNTTGIEEALRILHLIWSPTAENQQLLEDNSDFIQSIMWVLQTKMDNHAAVKTNAVLVLKTIVEALNPSLLERLKMEFFKEIMNILREKPSQQVIKAALYVLTETCPWGRNKSKMVEVGAVCELIEIEIGSPSEKRITEMIFYLLAHLCSCAEGREQLVKHAGGIAVVSKRILRVSPATDDRTLDVLTQIARSSATREVLLEMLKVGAVSKLCMVLQADCETYLKKKARQILRLHHNVWNKSPCIQAYLLTRYTR